jgi:hypothetical protein
MGGGEQQPRWSGSGPCEKRSRWDDKIIEKKREYFNEEAIYCICVFQTKDEGEDKDKKTHL